MAKSTTTTKPTTTTEATAKQVQLLRSSYLKVSDALEDYHLAHPHQPSTDAAIRRMDRAMDEWNTRFAKLLKMLEPK